jgi:hypothetical protein
MGKTLRPGTIYDGERRFMTPAAGKQTGLQNAAPFLKKLDPRITELPDPVMAVNPVPVTVVPSPVPGNPNVVHSAVPIPRTMRVIGLVANINV